MLKTAFQKMADVLLPQFCLFCNKESAPFCLDCLSTIEINKDNFGFTLPAAPFINNFFCASSFQEKFLQIALKRFKYPPYLKTLSLPLAYLIISYFALNQNNIMTAKTGENKILIPVPLTKKKQKQRGFNQSELIARDLSAFYKLPLANDNLIKIKETNQQALLGKEERQKNVSGVFFVKWPERIKNSVIFLIDDVLTTGSTLNEAAKALKQAGASKVYGVTVAFEP